MSTCSQQQTTTCTTLLFCVSVAQLWCFSVDQHFAAFSKPTFRLLQTTPAKPTNQPTSKMKFQLILLAVCLGAIAVHAQDLDEAASEMDLDMAASGGGGVAAGAAGAG